MSSPYRTPVLVVAENPPAVFSLEAFGGARPDCPCCTGHAEKPGRVCHGRRGLFSRRHVCPPQPHFHPKCNACGLVWLMAPKERKS